MPFKLLPVFVAQFQINAIMPSNAPIGKVLITATYNNVTGPPQNATVVASAFGAFAVASGRGPGIVQNALPDHTVALNTTVGTSAPGNYVILWGTGLGPLAARTTCPDGSRVQFVDQCSPDISFQPQVSQIQVFVGGVPVDATATYYYAARGPQIAGVDQVQFLLPPNVPLGCYVPVQVAVNGNMYSNTVTLAISSSLGQPCSDAANPLSVFPRDGGTEAVVLLARLNSTIPTATGIVDAGVGEFVQEPSGGPLGFDTFSSLPPLGTCTYYNNIDLGGVQGGTLPAIPGATYLDAGASISIQGPHGTGSITPQSSGSQYVGLLGGVFSTTNPNGFLDPGTYTVSGTGGTGVGAFSFNMNVGAPAVLTPSSVATIATIDRSQPLTLSWTGGSGQLILIQGDAADADTNVTGVFTCFVPSSPATFTIPAGMLANLPTTLTADGNAAGLVLFTSVPLANQVATFSTSSGPTINHGFGLYWAGELHPVAFK
jgi:uncharacterized protein (TIGR03437 family)